MVDASDLWPPFGLVIRAGDLRLTPIADDDLPALVELVLAGIHDPDWMPFDTPWTLAPPAELPRRYAQHYWQVRAGFRPEDFALDFAVRHDGELVGVQGFTARDFAVLRTAETGSWLGAAFQGRGIGTRMRQAICAFLFDVLGATQISSAAFVDNAPSLTVSRKVGYRSDGTVRKNRQGTRVDSRRLLLDPDDFVRGEPIEVTGAEPLRAFLGVA